MKNKISLLLLFTLALLASCTKNTEEFDGPSINEIFSEFTVVEAFKADRDSVDFANGERVTFTATFNKTVDWKITIIGAQTNAVKIIEGTSRTLDASNAVWDGSVTDFPLFNTENCTAQLTIADVTDTFTVNEKISSRKVIEGFMVADFETGEMPGWTKHIQTGADMDFGIKNDGTAPEGNRYLNMAGTVNWDWLIGLYNFHATAYGAGTNVVLPLSQNASSLYFNCLIYGDDPNYNQSIVLFQFMEDENEDGTFDANNEDQYDYEIKVDWQGWRLVSVKYSDLTALVNGQPATPKGNGLHNPDKLGQVTMLHLANKDLGFASAKLDMVLFTENGPVKP